MVPSSEQMVAADRLVDDRGRLFVVSGPSGVGKDAVLATLFASPSCPAGLARCVTATTRDPRPGERPDVDYVFLGREEFARRMESGHFLEHALYNGEYYGTPCAAVAAQRAKGMDVVLKIEVQGALQVRGRVPDAVLIFVAPPSWEALEQRLRGRATDDAAEIEQRLQIARAEMAAASGYDYLVVNDTVAGAADRVRAIVLAERARIVRAEEAGGQP